MKGMESSSKSVPVGERVRSFRDRMRARGMRPVQMWVTDVRTEEFMIEAHRQSAAVSTSQYAVNDQAFIDAVSSDQV